MIKKIVILIVLLNGSLFLKAQFSGVIDPAPDSTVWQRLHVFVHSYYDSGQIVIKKYPSPNRNVPAYGVLDITISVEEIKVDVLTSWFDVWKVRIGRYVTADSTFYYNKVKLKFVAGTQHLSLHHSFTEKEIQEYGAKKLKSFAPDPVQIINDFIASSYATAGHGTSIVQDGKIDISLFADSLIIVNEFLNRELARCIIPYLQSLLRQQKYEVMPMHVYIVTSPSKKIAHYWSNDPPNSKASKKNQPILRQRKIGVLDRAHIFVQAMTACTKVKTVGKKGNPDTYFEMSLPYDMNTSNKDTVDYYGGNWTGILTDYAASDSLDVYKGVHFFDSISNSPPKDWLVPLHHPNPYLIGSEVYTVEKKVEMFNRFCWHIRNKIGRLTIEGKTLVLTFNCSEHWFKGPVAEFHRTLINESTVLFILTYILRGQLNNYKKIQTIWYNADNDLLLSYEYDWKNKLFQPYLELQLNTN